MAEQNKEFLKECKLAFPDLSHGEQTISLTSLLDGSSKNGEKNDIAELDKQREALLKKYGFASSGSMLIDKAQLGAKCTSEYKTELENQFVADTIKSAEPKMAEAILQGKKSATLLELGEGKQAFDTVYKEPKLTDAQQRIFDSINASKSLKAEIKAIEPQKRSFVMEISIREKR